jgi:hypothetical protein
MQSKRVSGQTFLGSRLLNPRFTSPPASPHVVTIQKNKIEAIFYWCLRSQVSLPHSLFPPPPQIWIATVTVHINTNELTKPKTWTDLVHFLRSKTWVEIPRTSLQSTIHTTAHIRQDECKDVTWFSARAPQHRRWGRWGCERVMCWGRQVDSDPKTCNKTILTL